MKELSIKEKAERYDKALDNAKVIHKTIRKDLKPIIEKFFPELKSEDERIRKRLIRYFSTFRLGTFAGLEPKKIIDWLEKQGEKSQGKSALEAEKEEKVDNANKVEPKDYNDIDPHFGKPIDKVEPKFKVGDCVCDDIMRIPLRVDEVLSDMYRLTDNTGGGSTTRRSATLRPSTTSMTL